MQEKFNDMEKLWALQTIVQAAEKKCHELSRAHDMIPSQTVTDLVTILLDSTTKVTHIQWTDSMGLDHGVKIYLETIKNL